MRKNENKKLETKTLKEKYGDAIVRGVPEALVKRLLVNTYTPVDEAVFTVKDLKGNIAHTPLMLSLNMSLESKLRYEAETDPTFKQIIPYVVVEHEDKIFCTHRLAGDARLTGSYSIGTGGHIDEGERIHDAFRRELEEEIGVKDEDFIGYLTKGYILDNSSEVNSVHLGVIVELKINRKDIHCLEKEKLSGEWITRTELKRLYDEDKLESWSRIVAENLFFKE